MRNRMAELIKEELDELDKRNDAELKRATEDLMAFDILKSIRRIEIINGEQRGYNPDVLLLRLYIDNGEREFVCTSPLWKPRDLTTKSLGDQFMNILIDVDSMLKEQREQKGE